MTSLQSAVFKVARLVPWFISSQVTLLQRGACLDLSQQSELSSLYMNPQKLSVVSPGVWKNQKTQV